MNAFISTRSWLAMLSLGYLLACSGKLNVGKTDDSSSGAGSGGAVSSAPPAAGSAGIGGSAGSASAPVSEAPAGCPPSPPDDAELSCSTEVAGCGYRLEHSQYEECDCEEWGINDLHWQCGSSTTFDASCPGEPPTAGADCAGHFGTQCPYPIRKTCSCDASFGTWQCSGPKPEGFPEPPAALDPTTPVRDLTEAQRNSWCAWDVAAVANQTSDPAPPDAPVGADGKTITTGCRKSSARTCSAAMANLSPKQCAQNLAVSSCAAPLSELTDCVTTMMSGCLPSPHGCARYFASPGCDGTTLRSLASLYGDTGGMGGFFAPVDCGIQVE
jgi:hypothetical protein